MSRRMSQLAVFLFLATSFSSLIQAAGSRQISLQGVAKFDQSPVLDGVLNEACWQPALAAPCLYEYREQPPYPLAQAQAEVKLGYDREALYLGGFFYYDDPVSKATDTWNQDWIHVVIDPDNVPGPAGGLDYVFYSDGTGLAGVFRIGEGGSYQTVQQPLRTGAVKRGPDGWELEVKFPWQELGKRPENGDVWSFALARYRGMVKLATGERWTDRATLSPGGLEKNQANQGFIVFGAQPLAVIQAVAGAVAERYGRSAELYLETGRISFGNAADERQRLLGEVRRSLNECAALAAAAVAEPEAQKETEKLRDDLRTISQVQDEAQATVELRQLSARLENLRGAMLVRRLITAEKSP